jgi:hypothetical protein
MAGHSFDPFLERLIHVAFIAIDRALVALTQIPRVAN